MVSFREWILQQEREYEPEGYRVGLNSEKMQELHDKIASGEIDIGPPTDTGHVDPSVDLRPKYTGEESWILHKASTNGGYDNSGTMPELRKILESSD